MNKYSRTGKLDAKFNTCINLGTRLKVVDLAIGEILEIGVNIRPYAKTEELHALYKERKHLRHELEPRDTEQAVRVLAGACGWGNTAEVARLNASVGFYQRKLAFSTGSTPAKHLRKWQKTITKMQGLILTLTQESE